MPPNDSITPPGGPPSSTPSSAAPASQPPLSSFSSRTSGESSGSQLDDMLDTLDADALDPDAPLVFPNVAGRRRPEGLAVTRRTMLGRQNATLAE